MKKSLLALAVLGAFAGVASAQSSVTLYGTVDLNARYVKDDGSAKRYSLSQDGINSSQLGFKGFEDLGGGLKAGFDLLSGVNADTGTANTKFWNRRAVVKLAGNFGEIRLGRDYTPSFWNTSIFDAFGTNGIGNSFNVHQFQSDTTYIRADNAIQYYLPSNLGGFYGQAMVAAGEGGPTGGTAATPWSSTQGRYVGARAGFAAGPFDVAVSAAQKTVFGGEKLKAYDIGGSYDLGVVKLLGYYDRETVASFKQNWYSFGAVVPLGQGEIHVGGTQSKLDTGSTSTKVSQFALGYVYNLSKRTAVYATASRLSNSNATQYSVVGTPSAAGVVTGSTTVPTSITAFPSAGGKSSGAEFGLRHFF